MSKCFICGKQVRKNKEWAEDYCLEHEDEIGDRERISMCVGGKDWGVVMEVAENGKFVYPI
jgi:hypothetical protein